MLLSLWIGRGSNRLKKARGYNLLYCGISRLERSLELEDVYQKLIAQIPFLACRLAENALSIPGRVVIEFGRVYVYVERPDLQTPGGRCSSLEAPRSYFRLKANGTIICPVHQEISVSVAVRLRFVEESRDSIGCELTKGEAALRMMEVTGDLIHPGAALTYFSAFLERVEDVRLVEEL